MLNIQSEKITAYTSKDRFDVPSNQALIITAVAENASHWPMFNDDSNKSFCY